MHHAHVIEGEVEAGVATALALVERELSMAAHANPDVVVLRYGLLSVDDARRVVEIAAQAPLTGESKAIIVAASRVYHESQNALLKLFEEPPLGTYVFLVMPTLGALLPTLRSRVEVHTSESGGASEDDARAFIGATPEKRSALIKKLATGRDEDERRENRDKAIALVDGIERAASRDVERHRALLSDIATLRGQLYDKSAPVKMILEHLAIVTPKSLI